MNTVSGERNNLNEYLEKTASDLDISEAHFEKAVAIHQSIEMWLKRSNSKISAFSPKIYYQGSFCLGTLIKPPSDEDVYRLDLVIEVKLSKEDITQQRLKKLIGKELINYAKAHQIRKQPKNGKRCWSLEYVAGARFYINILPSISDGHNFRMLLESKQLCSCHDEYAIAITSKNWSTFKHISQNWPQSNPNGYIKWFKERMELSGLKIAFSESKVALSVEASSFCVKTPLQRAIQLLKRHRDIVFIRHDRLKPKSVVITTLAAAAYQGETDVSQALRNITAKMGSFIVLRNKRFSIKNPVNPFENFALFWSQSAADHFYQWLESAQKTFSVSKN